MNHLESSFTGKNSFWRYALMIIAVFAAAFTVGNIPAYIALAISSAKDASVLTKLSNNPNDLTVLGISSNVSLLIQLFPFIIGIITFIILVRPLNKRSVFKVINGTGSFRWNRFLMSALIWLVISAVYLLINIKADPGNFSLNNKSTTLIPLILITIVLIPFQAGFEEIIFRGYLMQGFTVIFKNRFFPLIISAVLFGLIHGVNPEVKAYGFWTMLPQYILFGIIFGIIAILDDGIEAAMGAHAANNIFICIMLTNESSALQAPALFLQHVFHPWTDLGIMFLMGVIILVVMGKIFRWGSFSTVVSNVEPGKTVQVPYTEL